MAEARVMAGPSSGEFAKALARRLNLPLLASKFVEFPDGENKFTFEESLGGLEVFLVQSTPPPVDKHYMQLLLASHFLSQEGARVHAVIPYMGYARQDKQFLPGEQVTLGAISHLLRSAGVARVTTVDIHSAEGLSLFSMPIYSVSAIPALAKYVKTKVELRDPVVVAPDFGSSTRTKAFATRYGAEMVQLSKKRDRRTGEVKVERADLEVKGMDVVMVDDLVTTGGTVVGATKLLKDAGVGKIVVACVHPVLVGDARDRLVKAGVDEIIGTNTVPGDVSKVDATEPVAAYLRTLAGE